jgi:TPR repeat protein
VSLRYLYPTYLPADEHLSRSIVWYKKAADLGDKRAMQRLKGGAPAPARSGAPGAIVARDSGNTDASAGKGGKDKDCIIM